MTTRPAWDRCRVALALLIVTTLSTAAACGGGDPSSAPSPSAPSSSAPASPAPASSAPASSAPSSSGLGRSVVAGGVRVPVPDGWQVTTLTEAAQAEAVARESDPRVATFLRERVAGLAAEGALLYLYDFRALSSGTLATAELYRYLPGRTPAQAVDEVVLPALQVAGLTPVRGEVVLPAGPALTLSTERTASGRQLRNDVVVLAVGDVGLGAVGLSVTTVGPPRTDTAQLAPGLAAA